jgi:chromosomal replication initiation ATPase DnaA
MVKWKGEAWESFRDRHGDPGRDIVLVLARRCCGLTLTELGAAAGNMNYWSVSEAIRRIEQRRTEDKTLDHLVRNLSAELLNIET